MFQYKMDLHVHTALSPCADPEMTPPQIVHAAVAKGLDIIAITDHNAVANVPAVQKAAAKTSLKVIPGMELQTKEDIHLICLFPNFEIAQQWGTLVDKHLPAINNKPELFGEQWIMDHKGHPQTQETKLLLNSTDLSLTQAVQEVHQLGGVCFPAHVDRPSYSIINSLGFIPSDLAVSAVEISRYITADEALFLFPQLKNYTLTASSDAHYLADIGAQSTLAYFQQPASFQELILALQQVEGRRLVTQKKELAAHLGNLLQVALESKANQIDVEINENLTQDQLVLTLKANSQGVTQDLLNQAIDPFESPRKSSQGALGLMLLKLTSTNCNGDFQFTASETGLNISVSFQHSHFNRGPLGNITSILVNTIAKFPQLNLTYQHIVNGQKLHFDTLELRQELEDVALDNPAVLNWMTNYLTSSFEQLTVKR